MKRHVLVIAVGVVGLLVASAGVTATPDQLPDDQDIEIEPPNNSADGGLYTTDIAVASPNNITVVIETTENSPGISEKLEDLGASVHTRHKRYVQAEIQAGNLDVYRNLTWVENVRRPHEDSPTVVSEGVGVINADDVHSNGITGQNVKVGVLDGAGFDLTNPEISSNIAGSKSFKQSGGIGSGTGHGTAVAEVVADVAPDSELYVANFNTGVEYANAVNWMRNQDVDVIVMSASFFNQPYDGDGFISNVADDAVRNGGVVWVNSAGNYADDHWKGGYSNPDGDQWLNFASNDEANYLNGGNPMDAGDKVWVTLNWDDWSESNQDYDLHLIRASDDSIVASSDRTQSGLQEPTESMITAVPSDGRYYVAVEIFDAEAPQELEMFFVNGGSPEHNVAEGSVTAPAVGDSTISVGAFSHWDGSLKEYSSRGPTNDGRTGVDMVAPTDVSNSAYGTFGGTSAAAPHVGGVAALMLADDPNLSPQDVEQRLESTATDIRDPGEDTESGHGKIDALSAVQPNPPANFGVSIEGTNTPVEAGANISVKVNIENSGGQRGTQTVSLDVAGVGSSSKTVSLDEGESTTETFEIQTGDGGAGEYTAEVVSEDDRDSANVVVTEGTDTEATVKSEDVEMESDGVGETTIRIEASEGVSSVDVTVKMQDSGVEITDAEVGEEPGAAMTEIQNPTRDSVTFEYTDIQAGASEFELGSVEFRHTGEPDERNEAKIGIETENFNDESYEPFDVVNTDEGILSVNGGKESARIEVSIDETNMPVREGDMLTAVTKIANTGDRTGTQKVTAEVSELSTDSVDVSLEAGTSTTETFGIPTSAGDAGEYTLSVESKNDTDLTNITVEELSEIDGQIIAIRRAGDNPNELERQSLQDAIFEFVAGDGTFNGVELTREGLQNAVFEFVTG